MRCLCLTGGMDIKTISLIFSRHGFTVQEKAKANKPQTQEKKCYYSFIAWVFAWYRTKPRGPGGTQGPRPASPPTWRCLPLGWGPAPAPNSNWSGTVPRYCTLTLASHGNTAFGRELPYTWLTRGPPEQKLFLVALQPCLLTWGITINT